MSIAIWCYASPPSGLPAPTRRAFSRRRVPWFAKDRAVETLIWYGLGRAAHYAARAQRVRSLRFKSAMLPPACMLMRLFVYHDYFRAPMFSPAAAAHREKRGCRAPGIFILLSLCMCFVLCAQHMRYLLPFSPCRRQAVSRRARQNTPPAAWWKIHDDTIATICLRCVLSRIIHMFGDGECWDAVAWSHDARFARCGTRATLDRRVLRLYMSLARTPCCRRCRRYWRDERLFADDTRSVGSVGEAVVACRQFSPATFVHSLSSSGRLFASFIFVFVTTRLNRWSTMSADISWRQCRWFFHILCFFFAFAMLRTPRAIYDYAFRDIRQICRSAAHITPTIFLPP